MKVKADGTAPLWSALLPCPSVKAISFDAAGNVYAASPCATGINISKLNPVGSKLLYSLTVPFNAPLPSSTSEINLGLFVDTTGSAYVAGSSKSFNIPELSRVAELLSNAWFIKVNNNPPQWYLAITAQATPERLLPGQTIAFVLTITNNGPAQADDVVIFAGWPSFAPMLSCRSTGAGVCSSNQVTFPSIPPGKTETVEIRVQPNSGRNGDSFFIQASAWTLTSDINQDNNATIAKSVFDFVTPSITSLVGASFRLNGSSQLISMPPTTLYVAPNSEMTIEWPSPQVTSSFGTVVFQRWTDGSTDNPRTFTIGTSKFTASAIFGLTSTPLVSAGGVTNGASFAGGGVSPGEIVTVFGFNLGADLATAQVRDGKLTTQIAGVSVLFDGIPAPLIYSSAKTLAAIVPYEVAGKASTMMTVQFGSRTSTPLQLSVVDAAPGLFTTNASGAGQAAALNQDGSLNSPSNPAHPGEVIVLFGTGEGLVRPLPANGAIAGSPAPAPVLSSAVMIGGKPARVLYAAGAPGQTAGLIQINVEIPSDLPRNHHTPIVWTEGQRPCQPGVTIAID